MKKLKHWIEASSFDEIAKFIKLHYPEDIEENLPYYEEVHKALLRIFPVEQKECSMIIKISPVPKSCDECSIETMRSYGFCKKCPSLEKDLSSEEISYYRVHGYDSKNPEIPSWALDLTPWEEWLSLNVDDTALEKYSVAQVLAHIYWEITFHGWTQDQQKSVIEDLNWSKQEIEEAIKTGDMSNFMTLEELMEQLDTEEEAL